MVFHRLLLTSKHILVSTVFISLAWQINQMASCELRLHKNTRRRQQCIGIIVFSFVLPFFSVSRRLAFGNAEWPFPLSAIRLAHVQSLMRHSAGWMVGQEVENTEKKKHRFPRQPATNCTFLWHGSVFPIDLQTFPASSQFVSLFPIQMGSTHRKKKSIVYINICSTRLATKETSISNIANEIYFFIFFLPFLSCILSLRFSILESFLRVQISQAFVLRNELN